MSNSNSDQKTLDSKSDVSDIEFGTVENMNLTSPNMLINKAPDLKEFINYYKQNDHRSVWSKDFSEDDITLLHELAAIKPRYLVLEVKRLHDIGYQLGVEEAREVTRAKFLNIFQKRT